MHETPGPTRKDFDHLGFTAGAEIHDTLERRQTLIRSSVPEGRLIHKTCAFEGPDGYAQAGGIASRITGLTEALADCGFDTHLWFVGDPALPGQETRVISSSFTDSVCGRSQLRMDLARFSFFYKK